jgi:hypothetical protein
MVVTTLGTVCYAQNLLDPKVLIGYAGKREYFIGKLVAFESSSLA